MDEHISIEEKQEMILLYHSGELDEKACVTVEQWIAEDEDLLEFLEELDTQFEFLSSLNEKSGDLDIAGEVVQELNPGRSKIVPLFAAASALAACIVALLMLSPSKEKPVELVEEIPDVVPVQNEEVAVELPSYFKKREVEKTSQYRSRMNNSGKKSYISASQGKKAIDKWKSQRGRKNTGLKSKKEKLV